MDMKIPPYAILLLLPLVLAGCSSNVDLTTALTIEEITTGWYDAGIVSSPEGDKNKLVPTASFALKNQSQQEVASVQVNAVFKLIDEEEELGSAWVKGIGPEGLAPGASTSPLVLRCGIGYTGLEPRAQMLTNSQFKDARVMIYGKHGSATWVKLGEYRIDRQLLTR